MNDEEINALIRLIRRVPLHNMDEAEAVAALLQKLIHTLRPPETNEPPVSLRAVD